MAPEQIEGGDVDARTDIFAFGALLYEMVTGRPAFQGKTQASLFGAILKDEPPPICQLQPVAPPALDHLVRTCLAKDPDARFQSAHDVRLQLKWIVEGSDVSGPVAPPSSRGDITYGGLRRRLHWRPSRWRRCRCRRLARQIASASTTS